MKRAPGERLRVALALFVALLAAACAKRAPDLDATPAGAVALPLAQTHADALGCGRGDCTDWYRLEVAQRGELIVALRAAVDGEADTRVALTLTDASGATLARDQTAGRAQLALRAKVEPATYLVAVASNHPEAPVTYDLSARLELPPPPPPPPKAAPARRKPAPKAPPPPRFEKARAEVLEVKEGGPHGRAVLLDAGSTRGMRVGLRGRLLDGGVTVASLQIVEVYAEGCLARVDGEATATIPPAAVAEIDVPLQR